MRNLYLALVTLLGSLAIIYVSAFIYIFFNLNNFFGYTFKSLENLNFHEKYSKKVHHVREESVLHWLWKKPKVEDLLFTTINEIEGKELIVLFQGDSYMEQLTFPGPEKNHISAELVQKFKNKKKVGFINAGTGSYSPSVMSTQLDLLEEDFNITPNIVIAYIDQSDVGDENCRYKPNKIYENGVLKSVQVEQYLMWRETFNYSEVYKLSRIKLKDISKISKTFQLINFKIKYGIAKSTIRLYRKYISPNKINKMKLIKCYWSETERYLIQPKDEEIKYFSEQVRDYLNKMKQKKHIEKIFLVTFPHKKNFNKTYKLNVSDVIDNIVKNEKNITHINFSKILLNNENFNYKNIWMKDNVHLSPNYHGNLFVKNILEELSKYLN